MGFESQAAVYLWRISCRLDASGWRRVARLVKMANYFAFRALLPPQAKLGQNLRLKHYGLGVVVHPNVEIGDRVTIYHQVTIAGETWIGSEHRIIIGDDVVIGVGAKIIPRSDSGLRIGSRSIIGAGAVVTKDVPDDCIATGVPARSRPRNEASP